MTTARTSRSCRSMASRSVAFIVRVSSARYDWCCRGTSPRPGPTQGCRRARFEPPDQAHRFRASEVPVAVMLYRTIPDLSVRSEGDGRTVFGYAVRYDQADPIDDAQGRYTETWRSGVFA